MNKSGSGFFNTYLRQDDKIYLQAEVQPSRPIVDVMTSVAKKDFSKYKLAKAFIRWSRDHDLNDLKPHEIKQAGDLFTKINKALS